MAYSLNPSSDNCYEGTACLVNKLGIRDEKKLAEIEAQASPEKRYALQVGAYLFLFCAAKLDSIRSL